MTLTSFNVICQIVALAICIIATKTNAQTGIIASDTLRINGQAGNLNLVTGSNERTLNFPTQSGTLALVGDATGGGQCCPTDTSFVILNEVANNADRLIATSETYDVGSFGRELILAMNIYFPNVNGTARVQLETCSDLNSPVWYPIVYHSFGQFQGVASRAWIVRPAGTSEFSRNGPAIAGETAYTDTFVLKGWMKYIRMIALLWNGQAGKSIVANVTVR